MSSTCLKGEHRNCGTTKPLLELGFGFQSTVVSLNRLISGILEEYLSDLSVLSRIAFRLHGGFPEVMEHLEGQEPANSTAVRSQVWNLLFWRRACLHAGQVSHMWGAYWRLHGPHEYGP